MHFLAIIAAVVDSLATVAVEGGILKTHGAIEHVLNFLGLVLVADFRGSITLTDIFFPLIS